MKTQFKRLVLCAILMTGICFDLPAEASDNTISQRGIVEGFYGVPWSHQDRISMLRFMKQHDMNMYIYAPKDDPYHREKWRDDYPFQKRIALERLIQEAKNDNVEFVFAISPGLDMRFNGDAGDADIAALLHKFDKVYDMGVHSFAIFFDDINNKDAVDQVTVLNKVNKEYIHKKPGLKPLIIVPTQYNINKSMIKNGEVQPYTKTFSQLLDKDIIVMYTGQGVVCEGISLADMQTVEKLYGPRLAVWWNYPVNDYQKGNLALGPIVGLEPAAAKHMKALVYNPMEHAKLSEITLATGADFAKTPDKYNPEKSWNRALNKQYGSLAKDMKVFADHSQRMGELTHWALAGRKDAPQVRKHMDELWKTAGTDQGSDAERQVLREDFASMKQASANLQSKLPADLRDECLPQLKLLNNIADIDNDVLDLIDAVENDRKPYAAFLSRHIEKKEKELPPESQVSISGKTARAFISEGLHWYKKEAGK